jgi:hypothetical protein
LKIRVDKNRLQTNFSKKAEGWFLTLANKTVNSSEAIKESKPHFPIVIMSRQSKQQ